MPTTRLGPQHDDVSIKGTFANALLCCVGHERSSEPVHAVLVEVGQQDRLLCNRLDRDGRWLGGQVTCNPRIRHMQRIRAPACPPRAKRLSTCTTHCHLCLVPPQVRSQVEVGVNQHANQTNHLNVNVCSEQGAWQRQLRAHHRACAPVEDWAPVVNPACTSYVS